MRKKNKLTKVQRNKSKWLLKYLVIDGWKKDCEREQLSKGNTKKVQALVNTLNDERKKTPDKSFTYLENQFYLVQGRIEYLSLLQKYNELHTKHNKVKKFTDGLKAIMKGEI